MRDISQSQWVNCDLTRGYVGLNLSQHIWSALFFQLNCRKDLGADYNIKYIKYINILYYININIYIYIHIKFFILYIGAYIE